MKKKIQLGLIIFLPFLCIIGFCIYPVAAQAILHEAVEETSSGYGAYISRIDMQGDAVYEDESGYTEYALWLNGKNGYDVMWFSTRILVYIYYTAYYKIQHILPHSYVSYEWGTPPIDLMEWTGDWDYNQDHSEVWQWEVGNQEKYCNGENWGGTSGSGSYYSTYSQDGGYRYLGWVKSAKSGDWHKFDALLRLHIDNAEAENWGNGVLYEEYPGGIWIEYIEQIKVKLVFKFQYEWFGWKTLSTHTHILGDGTPSGDLSSIPLVLGTLYGLQ